MKLLSGKKIMATAAMGLVLLFGADTVNIVHAGSSQEGTAVEQNVQVQQARSANIDWTKGADSDITVIGIGLPPENMGSRGLPLARRAAVLDAYRYLAETIKGVQVDADSIMAEHVVKSDTVKSNVSALIQGARILEEGSNPDGSYYVKMTVPLFGVSNSVAAIAIPEISQPGSPEPLPEVNIKTTSLPKQELKEVRSAGYTGVIVDASGLGLDATFSPVIYDENGRAIYGIKNINPDLAISKGMVEYSTSKEQAAVNSRAGSNPLILRAVAVKGGRNSANKVNVVVTVDDGDKILLANEKSGMLQSCAVVFVK